MTVNTDGKRRWVELEYEVPGTVERVWEAIATGPGISSWFVRAEVEEREGGAIAFDVMPGVRTTGVVTAWKPPHRFAYEERDWMPDAPPLATECIVEARDGGRCVVRLVHSLFASSADWDDQIDGFGDGWPAFFRVLAHYLMHFDGQPCATVGVQRDVSGTRQDALQRMSAALEILGGKVEETITTKHCQNWLVRVREPAPGIALVGVYDYDGKLHAALSLYLYGAGALEARVSAEAAWQRWMAEQFP